MKEYLKKRKSEKVGLTRAGFPKEVYFEAIVKDVSGEVAILEDEKGKEVAIPIDKILMVGPPEKEETAENRAGFL